MSEFAPMLVGIAFFTMIAFIVKTVADGRRRREHLKTITEFHNRLLDKLGSVRAIKNAPAEEIASVVGWSAAQKVREFFELEGAEESAENAVAGDEESAENAGGGGDSSDRIDDPEDEDTR